MQEQDTGRATETGADPLPRRLALIGWSTVASATILAVVAAAAACTVIAARVDDAQDVINVRWVSMHLVNNIKHQAWFAQRAALARAMQDYERSGAGSDRDARRAFLSRLGAAGFVVGWRPRSALEVGTAGPPLPSGATLDLPFFQRLTEATDFIGMEDRYYLRLPPQDQNELARVLRLTHSSRVVIGITLTRDQVAQAAQQTQPPGTEFTFYSGGTGVLRVTHERGERVRVDPAPPLPAQVVLGPDDAVDLHNPLDLPGFLLRGGTTPDTLVRRTEERSGGEYDVLYVRRAFGPPGWGGHALAWVDAPAPEPGPMTPGRVLAGLALLGAMFAALGWCTARALRAAVARRAP